MKKQLHNNSLGAALIALSLLSACGGGGGGDSTSSPNPGPPTDNPSNVPPPGNSPSGPSGTPPAVTNGSMTMSCPDGANYQCSGSTSLRSERYGDNNAAVITLTSSGVQAYGRSTSDTQTPNPTMTDAWGLAPASGGLAEIRLAKDATGMTSNPVVILSNIGLSWDGKVDRPPIIETFRTDAGRVQLNSNGAVTFGPLPPSSDLNFYDFARRGALGTQANYANNVYFPRGADNPPRCPDDVTRAGNCHNYESRGLSYSSGQWRSGGTAPDQTSAARLHEDGDVHSGDDVPGPNGERRILPRGSGPGIPFPGSKGYRTFYNQSYQYGNLAAWLTQDTVELVEWANGSNEHNKNRRGIVAYGDVTNPANVPTSGTASYSGIVYGWYANSGTSDSSFPMSFGGNATVNVNLATREVVVTVTGDNGVPLNFTANTLMGLAGTNTANYLTGAATSASLRGGVSGRFFGPISGNGPAEVGGALSLTNASTGATIVGGFIARKQ